MYSCSLTSCKIFLSHLIGTIKITEELDCLESVTKTDSGVTGNGMWILVLALQSC